MDTIDLNADLGEAEDAAGIAAELAILDVISSANIACGGHAGDEASMRRTVQAAKANGVTIGAHPAYPDRENFGRVSKVLGQDIDAADLREAMRSQILALMDIAIQEGTKVCYVKPHGALYNDAVFNGDLARLIAQTVKNLSADLILMGAPNSELLRAAKDAGLRFVSEAFIDRRYTDDGHLQSRTTQGAVITDQFARMAQVKSLAASQTVKSASGKTLSVKADSLCLHGDSAGAVDTARLARGALEDLGLAIKSFAP